MNETHRFEWLLAQCIEPPCTDASLGWDWRTGVVAFFNAICNTHNDLEVRCELRGELYRRGLGHLLGLMGKQESPAEYDRQVEVWIDERDQDLAELRALHLNSADGMSESDSDASVIASFVDEVEILQRRVNELQSEVSPAASPWGFCD